MGSTTSHQPQPPLVSMDPMGKPGTLPPITAPVASFHHQVRLYLSRQCSLWWHTHMNAADRGPLREAQFGGYHKN